MDSELQMEKDELRNKFIEYGMLGGTTSAVFSAFDANSRRMKMLDFVRQLKSNGAPNTNIVNLLKSLSIDDMIITRIISYAGGDGQS